MGKKNKRKQRSVAKAGRPGRVGATKFTAPTPGREDVHFTWVMARDATKFEDAVSGITCDVYSSHPRV